MMVLRCAALASLMVSSACATSPETPSAISFEERLLATIPADWDSPRGFDDVIVHFSPDGRSVALLYLVTGEADEHPRCYVVVNGRKEPEVGRVGQTSPCFNEHDVHFSPDSRRVAYVFRLGNMEEGREGLMVDGKPGPKFDLVEEPVFSSDSRRFAYRAVEKDKSFVVFDHVAQGREFDRAEHPRFSLDGRRTAFRAIRLKEPDASGWRDVQSAFIVVDGVKQAEYDWVGPPVFDPSHVIAYAAKKDGVYRMIRGHQQGDAFDYLGPPFFSSDGKRMACVAGRNGRFFILVDGHEFNGSFPSYGDPFFSPDGRHVAFLGMRDVQDYSVEGQPPLGTADGRLCMVVDQDVGEDATSIHEPRFGPDGRRLLYSLSQGRDWFVMYGREKFGSGFDFAGDPAVSPDGSRIAFKATKDGEFIVCGDQRSDSFDWAGQPVFSPDGRKIAFGARKGRELWWKVMDVK